MSKLTKLIETVYGQSAKIDREAGVIHRVKVLGRESKNGRTYSDKALDDAARLYEGQGVNLNHDLEDPYRNRRIDEGFGELRNVKREADGVYADLHYLKSHSAAPVVLESAERFPDKLGLSHNAEGKTKRSNKKDIVESIDRVISVDVVRNPATNKGLFESTEKTMSKSIREILEANFPKTAATCGLIEEDMAMAVEAPAAGSSDDQIKAAFRQAVVAAFDDEKLDSKATLKKIKDILTAYDKLTGSSSGGDSGKDAPETPAVAESKTNKSDPTLTKLLETVERLEKRDSARGLMVEFELSDASLLESLVKLPDEKSMRELCEREAKLRPAGRRAKPFMESVNQASGLSALPKTHEEFVAALR